MFAKAYRTASEFTQPVIISIRLLDGTVSCSCGAFVVLNEDGWIVTAAHLWKSFVAFKQHRHLVDAYRSAALAIDQDDKLDARQKQKKARRLQRDPKWITNHSFWWSRDQVRFKDVAILDTVDLAVARLEPWDRNWVSTCATIKDPAKPMEPGTALCKLGYPFHEISATYDDTKDTFRLAPGTLPIPRFPLEGIYTRNAVFGKTPDGKYDIHFLETSSPGLRGQSGGPIFDVNATVWAIQSRTINLPLGFTPKIEREGRFIEENQFLNVGLGVHASVIVAVLHDLGIPFRLSDY
jgi:hypothetical protein